MTLELTGYTIFLTPKPIGETIGTITGPYRVSQRSKYRVFPKFWVKITKFLKIGQIGQVKGQIISKLSQDVKKTLLGGIQGVPIGNTGCPKKMQNFQNGQIGQVRYQITST